MAPISATPRFPQTGRLHNQTKEFQPRVGFNYDLFGQRKVGALRGSAGIFNARQNMLTEVGAITTNGVQQQTHDGVLRLRKSGVPGHPSCGRTAPPTGCVGAGVTVFDKNYHNPRIYTFNVGFDQQISNDYVAFAGLH